MGRATSFILIVVGAFLIYFGNRYNQQAKQTSEISLQMMRDDGKIDARALAQRIGISEVDVRTYIAEAQRKGIIPFKADIV